MSDSTATGSVIKKGPDAQQPNNLVPGQPWRGTKGPDGATFEGWVLVQLWSPTGTSSGVTVHWSGDKAALFERAGAELTRLKAV